MGHHIDRIFARLNGRVFRRQAKRIPTHRTQNIVALHPLVSRDHIHRRKNPPVAGMQTLTGRIGKHPQNIRLFSTLRSFSGVGRGHISPFRLPAAYPFLFYLLMVKFDSHLRLAHWLILPPAKLLQPRHHFLQTFQQPSFGTIRTLS